MSQNCRVTDDMLNRYLDGELSVSKQDEFDRMLRGCPDLREEVDGYKSILKSLRAFKRLKFPPDKLRQTRSLIMQRVATLS